MYKTVKIIGNFQRYKAPLYDFLKQLTACLDQLMIKKVVFSRFTLFQKLFKDKYCSKREKTPKLPTNYHYFCIYLLLSL